MINLMDRHNEHILLIENDLQISDVIAEQCLKPLGFLVDVYQSDSLMIEELKSLAPDVIMVDLNLPGLSGKDLLLAWAPSGMDVPIIVIANKGQEAEVLQTFRLGVTDYILSPISETEVVNVVENTLRKKRLNNTADSTPQQIDQTKNALERQFTDFSKIFSLFKLAFSSPDAGQLIEKITNLIILLTEADSTWILTLESNQAGLILRACQNVPPVMQSSLNLSYEDDLSSLVSVSGRPLSLHGDALNRFTGLEWIGAALSVPVLINGKVSAIITAARNEAQPFNTSQQAMLEFAAEYIWVILENARRVRQMEQSLVYLQQSIIYATIESNMKYDLLRQASLELRNPLKTLMENVDRLLDDTERKLNRDQATAINDIQVEAEILMDVADSMVTSRQEQTVRALQEIDLNEIVGSVVNRFRPIAQMARILIELELPAHPSMIKAYPLQITKTVEGLLSNALKYSPTNSEVNIHIDQNENNTVLRINNQGDEIDDQLTDRLFEIKSSLFGYTAKRFGGIGISLAMIKEIISAYNGQIWINSVPGSGFSVSFSLPRG
jgi:signal transduction histidine kinase